MSYHYHIISHQQISLAVLLPDTNTGHAITCAKTWPIAICRGYYMVERRYEFFVRVSRTIELFFLLYSVLFFLLYRHTDDSVFDDFPKIFRNRSEGQMNVPEHFPEISEDCRRLSRKTRICFDHAGNNEFQ